LSRPGACRRLAAVLLLLSVALPALAAPAEAAEKVVLGFGPSLTSALDVIAENQGYFAREGLQAELREFDRGSKAMEALFRGEIDMASSTAFSVVVNSFSRTKFLIFTTVAVAGNDNQIVARRDRGVNSFADLKGKRVGVVKGGMSQYVLDLLILQAGLGPSDLAIIFEEPRDQVKRLAAGDLDAICTFGSWLDMAKEMLGANAVVFTDESLVRVTTVMTILDATLRARPALTSKVLRAYIRAENFIRGNPDLALRIVTDRFKMDYDAARKIWKPNLFHVSLDQSIIGDLENMAQWNIDAGMVKAERPPNYLDLIWFQGLEGIDPNRISIIH
jgi:NitT/TauT family transport system substrate-binding protein